MSCNRIGCSNIMCDTYIETIGYLCASCQDEFKVYLERENIEVSNENDIKCALDTFINIYKDRYTKVKDMSVDDFFNSRRSK